MLATPTAIMAAIGNATKHGFLVREGDALERLAKISVITFDKTGTLTHGTPQVDVYKRQVLACLLRKKINRKEIQNENSMPLFIYINSFNCICICSYLYQCCSGRRNKNEF